MLNPYLSAGNTKKNHYLVGVKAIDRIFAMTLTSRFNPLNAIFVPAFLALLLAALACLVGFVSFLEVESGQADSIFKTPIYGSLILLATSIGTIFHYLKILKKFEITNRGIQFQSLFKSEFIPWENVLKIVLIGKMKNSMSPMEATILELKDGRKFEIAAPFYRNIGVIRKTLEHVATSLDEIKPVEIPKFSESPIYKHAEHIDLHKMTKYSGNHLLSLNGAVIYGWIALTLFHLVTQNQELNFGLSLLILILVSGIFYGFLGYQLHYFYLDKDYLVVKNHVWPWVHQVYQIKDIKQVVFEVPYRRSSCLRVITKDYESRLFPAGSLRNKNWEALLSHLQNLGLEVRNETSIELTSLKESGN